MFKKKKNFFNYQNQIILTNGATLKIFSVKYIKNLELNQIFLKNYENNNLKNKNITQEKFFLKKLK